MKLLKDITYLILALCSVQGLAQEFNMIDGAYVSCQGSFNDSGGVRGNYGPGENRTLTICSPIDTDRTRLDFREWILAAGSVMTLYDGSDDLAPLIGTFTAAASPGIVTASGPGVNLEGCLTINFTSTAAGSTGWKAAISCIDSCQTITNTYTTVPAAGADGIVRVCQGDTITFNTATTFSSDGTNASFEYEYDGVVTAGTTFTNTFTNEGIYIVDFTATDNIGCQDRIFSDYIIHVSTDPDFTGTRAAEQAICFGDSNVLTGTAVGVEFALDPAPPIAGTTQLPDGSGARYQTCILVSDFAAGQTITNGSNIVDVFTNMEHEFVGDLDIIVSAPNGATVRLFQQAGLNAFFGIPVENDNTNPIPGTGFDYVFTEDPARATQTLDQAANATAGSTSVPAGDYLPLTSFNTFVGSPINGQWCITVTDNLLYDNGHIFYWGINFDFAILPQEFKFTPNEASSRWLPDPTIVSSANNVITVQPVVAGQACYTFEWTDTFNCTYTEDVCFTVNPEIATITPVNEFVCTSTGPVNFNLNAKGAESLNGLNPADYNLTYFESQTDADNNVNPIVNPGNYVNPNSPQPIVIRIENISTGCIAYESFTVSSSQVDIPALDDINLCDDPINDGQEVFDLTMREAQILGNLNPLDYRISYYNSQYDADNGINSIANQTSYTNVTTPETIFVRLELIQNGDCFDTGSFVIAVHQLPLATAVPDQMICDDMNNGSETVDLTSLDLDVLDGQSDQVFTVSYFENQNDADTSINPVLAPYVLNLGGTTVFYRIENDANPDCFTVSSFDFVVTPTPVVNSMNDLSLCDDISNDGLETFDLTVVEQEAYGNQNRAVLSMSYHHSQFDAETNSNPVAPGNYQNTSTPETIFIRIESVMNPDCFDVNSFQIRVNQLPIAGVIDDQVGCDDPSNDGIEQFDFTSLEVDVLNGLPANEFRISFYTTQANADTRTNPINFPYTNGSRNETIYYRIENNSNSDCFDTGQFEINVYERPVLPADLEVSICSGVDTLLDPGSNPDWVEFEWSTGDQTRAITVNQGGDYTLTVTNANGCDSSMIFTVIASEPATITDIEIGNYQVSDNTLTVRVSGSGDYKYSLDDFIYQGSSVFTDLYPGYYTVYVKDENGCGKVSQDVTITGAPPYFTPNEDGYHDTWQIIGSETIPGAKIFIYDRYGKLLKQISPSGAGWNGEYNGNKLPSSDYWYTVVLENGVVFKGHFALKR